MMYQELCNTYVELILVIYEGGAQIYSLDHWIWNGPIGSIKLIIV